MIETQVVHSKFFLYLLLYCLQWAFCLYFYSRAGVHFGNQRHLWFFQCCSFPCDWVFSNERQGENPLYAMYIRIRINLSWARLLKIFQNIRSQSLWTWIAYVYSRFFEIRLVLFGGAGCWIECLLFVRQDLWSISNLSNPFYLKSPAILTNFCCAIYYYFFVGSSTFVMEIIRNLAKLG